MKKHDISIIAATLLFAAAAYGQDNLDRQVEVTRSYEPSVRDVRKINIMPDMTDTAQMRPDYHYDITPRPLEYGFAVNPLQAAAVNTVEAAREYPFYLRAGLGGPFQSTAEFRYAQELNPGSTVGAYLNHYGYYGKVKNDTEVKVPTVFTMNRVGAFKDNEIGDDLYFGAKLDYGFNKVTRYGYYNYGNDIPAAFDDSKKGLGQFFHYLSGDVKVGNSFRDLSKFNFSVGLNGEYFADRFRYDQFTFGADVQAGFSAGYDSDVRVRLNYTSVGGMNKYDDYSNGIFRAGASYHYDNGSFRFMLGADYGYGNVDVDGYGKTNAFLPQFDLEFGVIDERLRVFTEIRSKIEDNSYGRISKQNPYVMSGWMADNTLRYDGLAGIKGTLGSSFKYRVFGGYSRLNDTYYFCNRYADGAYGNTFGALTDDLDIVQAGAEVELSLLSAFTVTADFRYFHYSPDKYEYAGDLPEFKSRIALGYQSRNRFFIELGVDILGKRYFYGGVPGSANLWVDRIDPVANLGLRTEYLLNDRWGIFVRLDNLLGQDIYPFNHYRSVGVNGMAGVRVSF